MATVIAPIAFFAFNRPAHTSRTLEALAANAEAKQSDLHIFVDGARNEEDRQSVSEVLRIATSVNGFRSVAVHADDTNKGLYGAITSGVSSLVGEAKRVIVVEDDILVSPHFLAYMNDALARYESIAEVGCIHGYCPSVNGLPEYFFLRGGDCWGWATWADRWALFDGDASKLRRKLVSRSLLVEFCSSRGGNALLYLLRRALGRNQSWAVLWDVSLFLAGRYTLQPGKSLVSNIGNDGSGVHAVASSMHDTPIAATYAGLPEIAVEENRLAAASLSAFFDGDTSQLGLKRSLKRTIAMLAARFPLLTPP